jgi:hypothetical protein
MELHYRAFAIQAQAVLLLLWAVTREAILPEKRHYILCEVNLRESLRRQPAGEYRQAQHRPNEKLFPSIGAFASCGGFA